MYNEKLFGLKKWLVLRTTNYCNHNCLFCTQKEYLRNPDYKFLKFNENLLNNIWDIIQRNGYNFILISWWETTLNKDIISLIQFFQKKWIYVILMTNGSNIHNLDIESINRDMTIYVSYHWFQDTYTELINKGESTEINQNKPTEFEVVSTNIVSLQKLWFNLILKVVINKYNISSLELFVEYIFHRFWDSIWVEITLMEYLQHKDVRKLSCNISDFNTLCEKLSRKYGNRITIEWWKLCDKEYFWNNYDTVFCPLTNKIVWEIKIEKDGKIFYQEKTEPGKGNIKNVLPKCKTCKKFSICHGYDFYYLKK